MRVESISCNIHKNHLFNEPLCKKQSILKRIANVVFHVLTIGIPLGIYHIISIIFPPRSTSQENKSSIQDVAISSVKDQPKPQSEPLKEKINTNEAPLQMPTPTVIKEETVEVIKVETVEVIKDDGTIRPYSELGRKAIEFAREKLKEQPNLKPKLFVGRTRQAETTEQPSNPEITLLNALYLKYYKDFTDVAKKQGEKAWETQEVILAADSCMKIAYAISALTLDDLGAFTAKLPRENDNKTVSFCKSLTHQYYYMYRAYFCVSTIYADFRGGITWKMNSEKTKEQFIYPDKVPSSHSEQFYKEGTSQNNWNKLYNDYCERVCSYVSEKDLRNLDERFVLWIQKDTVGKEFRTDHSLPT